MSRTFVAVVAGVAIAAVAIVWSRATRRDSSAMHAHSSGAVESTEPPTGGSSQVRSNDPAVREPERAGGGRAGIGDTPANQIREHALTSGWTIEGRVLDASGAPAPGVSVDFFDSHWDSRANTDASGRFGPTPFIGSSDIDRAAATRIAFELWSGGDVWLISSTPVVDEASRRFAVELRLTPHARLEGNVRRADGTPADRVEILATRLFASVDPLEMWTVTDEAGDYSMWLCGSGPYRIELGDDGGPSAAGTAREMQLGAGTTIVDFVDPRRARSIPAAPSDDDAPVYGSVRGHLHLDPTPAPCSSATVRLIRRGVLVDEEPIEKSGDFSFESVDGNEYTIAALWPGYARTRIGPFIVIAGRCTELDTQVVKSHAPLNGRVVDRHGTPQSRATVTLYAEFSSADGAAWDSVHGDMVTGTEAIETTRTNTDGCFTLRDSGGLRELRIDAEGFVETRRKLDGDAPPPSTRLEIVLDATRRVRGIVEVPDNFPCAALRVSGTATWSCVSSIASDGSFELTAAPTGEFDVEIIQGGGSTRGGYFTFPRESHSRSVPDGLVIARRTVAAGLEDVDLGRVAFTGGK